MEVSTATSGINVQVTIAPSFRPIDTHFCVSIPWPYEQTKTNQAETSSAPDTPKQKRFSASAERRRWWQWFLWLHLKLANKTSYDESRSAPKCARCDSRAPFYRELHQNECSAYYYYTLMRLFAVTNQTKKKTSKPAEH